MGFTVTHLPHKKGYNRKSTDPNYNGVSILEPGESVQTIIDLQESNCLRGDISIQGICDHDSTVDVYYSNWITPFNKDLPFTNLDLNNIQTNVEEKCLWFKFKTYDFVAQTPKHIQMALPISRYILLIVKGSATAKTVAAIYPLTV